MVSWLVAVIGLAIVAVAPGQSRAANLTTLVNFCSLPNCADGSSPQAGLIADAKGNLFGTTITGGEGSNGFSGGGTVFEIAKTANGYASAPTTLVSFCSLPNCTDGAFPGASLIIDADGNLFGTTLESGPNGLGTVFEIAKTADGYASTPTTLVSFNGADGERPGVGGAGVIIDANGNLFGTTIFGGAHGDGTVFKIAKTADGYASTPTTLVSFCALANCADGAFPRAGLIADANGNLFGTTFEGGAGGNFGTVFEIAKTADGYASTPTTLVSFCSLPNCADGSGPLANLIADANGNLFGTASEGGNNNGGTAFEVTDSGFVAHKFAGTPGKPNCFGQSVSALARQYGGLNNAAEALGYPSVRALQDAITEFCEPDKAAEHGPPDRNREHHHSGNSISPLHAVTGELTALNY
jgi:uncharacterized repeat protein (TIGR03803 family)